MKIDQDKWKHFYVGMLMAVFFQILLQLCFQLAFNEAVIVGFILVNIVGFGFELFSYMTKWGHAELKDAFATLLGGVAGAVLIVIARKVLFPS
ncbi:MAG TPA: hypothetical protein VL098_07710 [Flavipsychrobacter sp.]|nr:hypothetical protein [Flavipsychrobacter sp.]